MRVVFDTNIFISALVVPGSQAEKAIERIAEGRDELFYSEALLDELLSVLARKFSRNAEELARVAVFVDNLAEPVEPSEEIAVLADDPDNRVLECAVAADAGEIVTGDKDFLALESFREIRIVTLGGFLGMD